MTVVAYTDASHCHKTKYAACGFVVLKSCQLIKHQVTLVENMKSAQDAETHSVIEALQYCFMIKDVKTIILYTDYLPTITRKDKDKKRLFPELYDTVEMIKDYGIQLQMRHVRGHSGNEYNEMVDRSCRKYLKRLVRRYYIKKQREQSI